MTTLRTCPDCGGILEPSRPEWIATIEMATSGTPEPSPRVDWQCLICGYVEEEGTARDGRQGMPALR